MRPTRFTELVGCEAPIQLAPMAGIVTPEMAEAVARAGGHAMLGAGTAPVPALTALFDDLGRRGVQRFGVNFLIPFTDPEVVKAVAKRAPLVDFYLGAPDRALVEIAHDGGALAAWQVTSVSEAVAAAEAGCDLVIAHGIEAGGRNPGGIGLLPLLGRVLEEVDLPVVAAGGIATARGVAAALAAGADGVRVGTRFVASKESGAHPEYIRAIVEAGEDATAWTEAFHVFMPEGLYGSRVLRSAIENAAALSGDVAGEMQAGPERMAVPRFSAPPPVATTTGEITAMALYAGQGVASVREVQPAAAIVAELVNGAEALLRGWC